MVALIGLKPKCFPVCVPPEPEWGVRFVGHQNASGPTVNPAGPGGMLNISAECSVLLHYEMAHTLFFFLAEAPVKGPSVQSRAVEVRKDSIDIHAACSSGVTSGRLVPQVSVITVSLVL